MARQISNERLMAQTTLNNISKNTYDVHDYRLCKRESEIVIKALRRYISDLAFDEELKVEEIAN